MTTPQLICVRTVMTALDIAGLVVIAGRALGIGTGRGRGLPRALEGTAWRPLRLSWGTHTAPAQ
jgi:hypothetical protein